MNLTTHGRGDSREDEARRAAAEFRAEHRLGHQPLGDLAALIEQTTGIDVAVLDAPPDEHGMVMRDPANGAVFIAVARTSHPMRQRSSLAHELAHVVFGDWNDGDLRAGRAPEEIRADAFARHLLVPVEGLRDQLEGSSTGALAMLSMVVQRFLVSPAIAAIALREAGYIDEATRLSLKEVTTPGLAARYGWADQYRTLADQARQHRAPQHLTARAVEGYLAHVVSTQTIATLRHLPVAEVEAELHSAGIVPSEQTVAWAHPSLIPPVEVDLSELDDLDSSDARGGSDIEAGTGDRRHERTTRPGQAPESEQAPG